MSKAGHGCVTGIAAAAAVLAAIEAGPATAQPFSAFGLQFNWEDTFERRGPELAICMTDRQIRQAITARGYTDIALNAPRDRRIHVRAVQGGQVFLLDFDFCNNTIIERQVLR